MEKRFFVGAFFTLCALSGFAVAKGDGEAKSKAEDQQVIKDRKYVQGGCGAYLVGMSDADRDVYISTTEILLKQDLIFYLADADTVLGKIDSLLKAEGFQEPKFLKIRDALKNKPYLARSFETDDYTTAAVDAATKDFNRIRAAAEKAKKASAPYSYLVCTAAEIWTGVRDLEGLAVKYQEFVMARPMQADVGYFDAKVNGCKAVTKVGTGNQFAEPKSWDGSRFYIVDATFKNTDTESRLPAAGSLFIKYNGKDYKFDSVEPVMLEGYNIWFKQINPLVSMKTKLVYRIPDEIEGEVFWGPGRNSEDVRLYCGRVLAKAAK